MKNKNILFMGIATTVCLVFIGTSAWAGSPQRHRWEGVAIGLGAALVGSALLHHHGHYPRPEPVPVYRYPTPPPCEYWGVERVWIPPAYDSVWIPGHCNRWGGWSPGRWEQRVRFPGHWEERPVCVQ